MMKRKTLDSLKKVVIVTSSFPVHNASTSGLFVKYLADAVSSTGTNIEVVTPANRSISEASRYDFPVFFARYAPKRYQMLAHEPGGIPVQIKHNPYLLLLVPSMLLSLTLTLFMRVDRHTIVHANWAVTGALSALVKMVKKCRLVTTLRGEDVKPKLGTINRFFLWLSLRYSDSIVLVSEDQRALLLSMYPAFEDKISVINNGVAPSFLIDPDSVSSKYHAIDKVRMVAVSSLIERKNISVVLEALTILVNHMSKDVELKVVGSGPLESKLKQQAERLGLGEYVIFTGSLDHEMLSLVLADAQIFVSASLHEGRPNAAIEAMASACCLVLSDIDGHRDLARSCEGVLLVNVSHPEQLANEILKLIEDKHLMYRCGMAARCFVDSGKLNWVQCAQSYRRLYFSER